MLSQKIKKIKLPKNVLTLIKQPGVTNIQGYKMDELIIITDRWSGKWHISISHPMRLPLLEEIDVITAAVLPGISLKLHSIGGTIQFIEDTDAAIQD